MWYIALCWDMLNVHSNVMLGWDFSKSVLEWIFTECLRKKGLVDLQILDFFADILY